MIVKIYDYDNNDNETLRGQCDLRDCFPDAAEHRDPEYFHALSELTKAGRYWVGGGAGPLVLLSVVQS
jgi:hypothetical protein